MFCLSIQITQGVESGLQYPQNMVMLFKEIYLKDVVDSYIEKYLLIKKNLVLLLLSQKPKIYLFHH